MKTLQNYVSAQTENSITERVEDDRTVRDAKMILKRLISELDNFPDKMPFILYINDNNGNGFYASLTDIKITDSDGHPTTDKNFDPTSGESCWMSLD